ncbi:MAG TPA: type II secretion system protein [Candidatus Cloacimonetes bacterium]|nr:type II secretion system protein [Candidatus Cloacimonadota bacterium]
MKKSMKNKGFTLIEVLITIAIIGILASVTLVSLNRSRVKANTAVLKSAVSSLRPALSVCCSKTANTTNAAVNPAANAEICSTAIGSSFPVAADLKATGVTYTSADCDGASPQPFIDVMVTGHSNTNCNGPAVIRVTENAIIFPAGC